MDCLPQLRPHLVQVLLIFQVQIQALQLEGLNPSSELYDLFYNTSYLSTSLMSSRLYLTSCGNFPDLTLDSQLQIFLHKLKPEVAKLMDHLLPCWQELHSPKLTLENYLSSHRTTSDLWK